MLTFVALLNNAITRSMFFYIAKSSVLSEWLINACASSLDCSLRCNPLRDDIVLADVFELLFDSVFGLLVMEDNRTPCEVRHVLLQTSTLCAATFAFERLPLRSNLQHVRRANPYVCLRHFSGPTRKHSKYLLVTISRKLTALLRNAYGHRNPHKSQ